MTPRQRTFASSSSRHRVQDARLPFGNGLTAAAPGSAAAALIVSDIEAARDGLIRRGIDASEMWHGAPFLPEARLHGPDPERTATGRSSPSMIPTATRGWSRRSQRGSPAASTRRRRPLHQQTIWQARCAALQPPTAITRSAADRTTGTGRPGTQPTWRRSRQGPSCRSDAP